MITWVIVTILACALLIYFWWIDRHDIDLTDGFERYPAGIIGRIMYALRLLAWIPGLAFMLAAMFAVPMLIVVGLGITVWLFSPRLADAMPILPLTAVFFVAYCGFIVYQGHYGKGSAYYERRMRQESELQWLRHELGLASRQSLPDRAKKISSMLSSSGSCCFYSPACSNTISLTPATPRQTSLNSTACETRQLQAF